MVFTDVKGPFMRANLYATLSGSETSDPAERRNFFIHAISLTLTKVADGLIDPKIVLSWLVTALGAPAAFVGFLVPIREAGALAPQLLIAPFVRAAALRKWFWVAGSIGQGICVVGIAFVAFTMNGVAAGWAILGLLAGFSIFRAICSTSHKDVLGKTVKKSTRGAATGIASSLAATGTLTFGALLALGIIPRTVTALAIVITVAGIVWVISGLVFTQVDEEKSETDDVDLFSPRALLEPLRNDPQLRRFIAARALLVPTALAPPFLIAMAASGDGESNALGPFILASALASILSGYVWGRLSDRSSRWTFIAGGGLAAIILALAAIVAAGAQPSIWTVTAMLFAAQIGYEGVRSARKIHLVDMAEEDKRAVYTALSNTLIGIILILGGVLGIVAQAAGVWAALALSSVLCAAGAAVAYGLDEVQQEAA